MNKEKIKEVIDNLNGVVKGIYRMDEAGLEIEDIEIILNYITNLQKENKRLNNIIDETLKYAKYQCENFEFYEDTNAKLFSVVIIMMLENKNILKGDE